MSKQEQETKKAEEQETEKAAVLYEYEAIVNGKRYLIAAEDNEIARVQLKKHPGMLALLNEHGLSSFTATGNTPKGSKPSVTEVK